MDIYRWSLRGQETERVTYVCVHARLLEDFGAHDARRYFVLAEQTLTNFT